LETAKNLVGVPEGMKNSTLAVLGIALLLLCSFSFADAAGAAQAKAKMSALGNATAEFAPYGKMASYDNFFVNGTEYAVAGFDLQPSYLLLLEKKKAADNSTETTLYDAKIIRDAGLIEKVYKARMSSYSKPSGMLTAMNDLPPLVAKFEGSRTLGEKRCNVLLGIDRNRCRSANACAYSCNLTTLCSEFLAKNSGLPEQMLSYSNNTAEMDLINGELNALGMKLASDGASLPLLDSFDSAVGRLKNASAKAAGATVISGGSVCTPIAYDMQSVADAAQKISAMQSAAAGFKNQETSLVQILAATAKLPAEIAESAPGGLLNESLNSTAEPQNGGAANESNAGQAPVIPEPKITPAPAVPLKEQDNFGTLIQVMVALIIAGAVVYLIAANNKKKGLG